MAYLKDDVPGLDVHSTNISGCGAAHWAGATGNVATCKWLFANGFDLGVTNHANHGLVNSAAYKGTTLAARAFCVCCSGGRGGMPWHLGQPAQQEGVGLRAQAAQDPRRAAAWPAVSSPIDTITGSGARAHPLCAWGRKVFGRSCSGRLQRRKARGCGSSCG